MFLKFSDFLPKIRIKKLRLQCKKRILSIRQIFYRKLLSSQKFNDKRFSDTTSRPSCLGALSNYGGGGGGSFFLYPQSLENADKCMIVLYVLGRVINVSSVRGVTSFPRRSAYHVTKHALETFSDSLRLEMTRFYGSR